MTIWIQSLSWALIYSLAQGFLVYSSLWLVLKLIPAMPTAVKYHLSLSALAILFVWFVATWQQQFHLATLAAGPSSAFMAHNSFAASQSSIVSNIGHRSWNSAFLSAAIVVFPWLSVGYVAGVILMLIRLCAGMLQLFSLKKTGVTHPSVAFEDLLDTLKKRLHFASHARLLISARAQAPMVIGILKPVILMPAAAIAQLSMQQLEAIILHELAHLKRHDHLVNILQAVIETLLFFNPFIWITSAIIRREREHCCDDLVLAHTREPLSYATALATLAGAHVPFPSLSVAATGQPNYLYHRITRIMEKKKSRFSYSRMVAALIIVSSIACSVAWINPKFSHTEKEKPQDAAQNAGSATNTSEESQLIQQLEADGRIDEVKGFLVEKSKDILFIDGKQLPDNIAAKYLSAIKKTEIRVQVYPFMERLKMHPDASFIQVLLPVMMSSPCVDNKPKKPGC